LQLGTTRNVWNVALYRHVVIFLIFYFKNNLLKITHYYP